ncbi:MAG: hypothetical protein ACRDZP_05005 [Acidimicrobiales bacterium]
MGPDLAELSSISSSLDQLGRRLESIAEAADRAKDESSAAELFGIERALSGATRRLTRFVERRQ